MNILYKFQEFIYSSWNLKRIPSIRVIGTEVVQSIQSMSGDVPLIAGKRSLARVYVEPVSVSGTHLCYGVIKLTKENGKATEIRSIEPIVISGVSIITLEEQRSSLANSFNFLLPSEYLVEGNLEISLVNVDSIVAETSAPLVIANSSKVSFEPELTLRVRVIGLRVKKTDSEIIEQPDEDEFERIGSWLLRAFPCSSIDFSYTFIDGAIGFEPPYVTRTDCLPDRRWQKMHDLACTHLMAHRAEEVRNGRDPRTYYYAIVEHDGHDIHGAVSNVSDEGRSDIVGVGPAGDPDGTLAGHELAHALGCLHPGYGTCQSKEDENYPDDNRGRISNEKELHIGWDCGDEMLPMRIFPYTTYDFMTYYSKPHWVSAHYYKKILSSLRKTERVILTQATENIYIAGLYSLTEKSGEIKYVDLGDLVLPKPAELNYRVEIEVVDIVGKTVDKANIEQKSSLALDLHQDSGAFQLTIPYNPDANRLTLKIDGIVVHTYDL